MNVPIRRQYFQIPNKDQLSLTNPRDALHHGERAVNKLGGRSVCDKPATELS